MKTLIELYDERSLENVLSTEVFRPERTVFVCPPEVAGNSALQERLRAYFRHRGVQVVCEFAAAKLLEAQAVAEQLCRIAADYPDCALDIAGGTDAALFAAGLACAQAELPVFTYSRRRNAFFDIRGAAFADRLPCQVRLSVEDCLLMAGGAMKTGRVDNACLKRYMALIEPLFAVYMRFRREWPRVVAYMQRVSPAPDILQVEASYTVPGERGGRLTANAAALTALAQIGVIKHLEIESGRRVRFAFADAQSRVWLRDVGSPLELYAYKACLDTGAFQDVRLSVVVEWPGERKGAHVSNELDVAACCGVRPVFISCKSGEVKTEALNELALLRDRFGGQSARAAIITAQRGRAPMRQRAFELGIDVMDIEDLRHDLLRGRLKALSN